jgi:hypothetical protein
VGLNLQLEAKFKVKFEWRILGQDGVGLRHRRVELGRYLRLGLGI